MGSAAPTQLLLAYKNTSDRNASQEADYGFSSLCTCGVGNHAPMLLKGRYDIRCALVYASRPSKLDSVSIPGSAG